MMMLALVLGALAVALVLIFALPGSTPRIDRRAYPRGLAVLEPVPVRDTQQWVLIRTEDVRNPLVLFVHGGPGTSQLALMRRNTQALERHFTVVNWDQRLAGKSFAAGGDATKLEIAQFVDDLIDLAESLTKRFDQPRLLLVGHSWGSAIGILAAARRPDLFSAYVGIGQLSRMLESERISYDWTLATAREAGDAAAVAKLTALGPPPYLGEHARAKFVAQRKILGAYGGEVHGSKTGAFGIVLRNVLSREYTMLDRINFFRGVLLSVDLLLPELYRLDLFALVPALEIPVYFCLGRHDREVPSELSAQYFESLQAPRKELIWFESSAHMPNTEEREAFNRFMIERVLPSVS